MSKITQETSYKEYLETGKIYGAMFNDICLVCNKKIGDEKYVTSLKLDPTWDKKEPFDFYKHSTNELKGYKHFKCTK